MTSIISESIPQSLDTCYNLITSSTSYRLSIFIFRVFENVNMTSPHSYGSGVPLAEMSSKQGTTLSSPQSFMDFFPFIFSIN